MIFMFFFSIFVASMGRKTNYSATGKAKIDNNA